MGKREKKWHVASAAPVSKLNLTLEMEDIFFSVRDNFSRAIIVQELGDEELESVSLDWFSLIKKKHRDELTEDEMTLVIKGMHDLIRQGSLNYINDILASTLTSASSAESIVTLLRSSFPVKEQLSNWMPLLRKAKSWLSSKGMNPDLVLIGMC